MHKSTYNNDTTVITNTFISWQGPKFDVVIASIYRVYGINYSRTRWTTDTICFHQKNKRHKIINSY